MHVKSSSHFLVVVVYSSVFDVITFSRRLEEDASTGEHTYMYGFDIYFFCSWWSPELGINIEFSMLLSPFVRS